MNEVLTNETIKPLRERLVFGEGVIPVRDKSIEGRTVFELSQMDQGFLAYMLSIDTWFSEYNFYCEIDKTLLDETVPDTFPNSVKTEEPLTYKTLREYLFGAILENETNAFIKIDYSTASNGNKIDNSNLTQEFLVLFTGEYGNDTLSNIYTSKEAIETKRAEYNVSE